MNISRKSSLLCALSIIIGTSSFMDANDNTYLSQYIHRSIASVGTSVAIGMAFGKIAAQLRHTLIRMGSGSIIDQLAGTGLILASWFYLAFAQGYVTSKAAEWIWQGKHTAGRNNSSEMHAAAQAANWVTYLYEMKKYIEAIRAFIPLI